MSFRLLKITTNYPAYLHEFYSRQRELASQPYAAQHAALMADCFFWAGSWSLALRKLGYVTEEIVANAEPLQKRWASENGLANDETNWLLDISAAQVRRFQPEVLFVTDHHTFGRSFLRRLRSENPCIRLVLGWIGAPYGAPYTDAAILGEYDAILSNIPELVQHFKQLGHRSYHMNHAFDPHILERIDQNSEPTADFVFLGSIFKAAKYHTERERFLLEMVRDTDLQIWSDVQQPSSLKRYNVLLRRLAYDCTGVLKSFRIAASLVERTPLLGRVARWTERPSLSGYIDRSIARRSQFPLFGLPMFQQLHDSRVSLNTHIDVSHLSASNLRLYEATGVGTCLLTDWKANLSDLFDPETEVITYRCADECIEKLSFLLDHEHERRAIAEAGQRRTLRDHSFNQRAEQLDSIIREL